MIDTEHQQQLLTSGYTAVRGAVPPPLLERLRDAADRIEALLLADHAAGRSMSNGAIFDTTAGLLLERANRILELEPDLALELLATPALVGVARDLCGEGAVPIEMDLLYKRQHPDGSVIWHQGAQHSRRWPYLNVGVYLDDAPVDDGCVRYVPGTQGSKLDICELAEEHGWDIPGSVDAPVTAGDVLVQDMMVLHCSLPKRAPGVRRTIYIEIRPSQAIVGDQSQSPEWAALRERWMALVLARAEPGSWPAGWHEALPEAGAQDETVAAIAARWEPPLPSHYCHRAVDHPDYPVPADLR